MGFKSNFLFLIMEFKNLHSDISPCDCIQEAAEDKSSVFVRKIDDKKIKDRNFRSKWEQGRAGVRHDCKGKCSAKGISVSNAKERDQVIKLFKSSFNIAPGFHPVMCFFKLGNGAGIVKPTPSKNNIFHCDFYKCDTFSVKNIDVIEYLELESA